MDKNKLSAIQFVPQKFLDEAGLDKAIEYAKVNMAHDMADKILAKPGVFSEMPKDKNEDDRYVRWRADCYIFTPDELDDLKKQIEFECARFWSLSVRNKEA